MKRRVVITAPAERDVLSNHRWWGERRSREQADRWIAGVYAAMWSLGDAAERHAYATEPALRRQGVRQKAFGLGRRPSHRILYAVVADTVVIYRVRALSQDVLDIDDLE